MIFDPPSCSDGAMPIQPTLKPRAGALLVSGVSIGLVCFAAGAMAQAAKPMVVIPAQEAQFTVVDPKRADSAQLAVLWGDPAQGPSAMLLKFKQGRGRLHVHTSDYHLVVLEGTMKHGVKKPRRPKPNRWVLEATGSSPAARLTPILA